MYRKGLYIVFHGFAEHSGITKKIRSQVAALNQCGLPTSLCSFEITERGEHVLQIDKVNYYSYGFGAIAKITKRYDFRPVMRYIKENGVDFVYIRHVANSNPGLVVLSRKLQQIGVTAVLEVPTYPYDREFRHARLVDRLMHLQDYLFRRIYVKQLSAIVTFSTQQNIFGKRTICISNGIDFDAMPLRIPHRDMTNRVRLISVSEMHYWHGLDRVLYGLKSYYSVPQPVDIQIEVIGKADTVAGQELVRLSSRLGLDAHVSFLGPLYGRQLDERFDDADIAIGSLGRHRSGITHIKTLKNREYAARGIPFVYSEIDSDFEHQAYILKVPADNTPLSMLDILSFYQRQNLTPEQIRATVVDTLSWYEQMRQVLSMLNS